MNEKEITVSVRLTPELSQAINRKRGEAFNAGAELSKHDVIVGTLCSSFGVPFTPGERKTPGRKPGAQQAASAE